jgi:hypothetical protein
MQPVKGADLNIPNAQGIYKPFSATKTGLKITFCNWIPYLCTNATPPEGVVFFFFYNNQEEDL